jgi:hypothetical protein
VLHEKRLKPETLAYDYYHNVEKANTVGFARADVAEKDVDAFDVSFSDCADLTMVAVLPVTFKQSETVTLASKAAVGGTFEIAIYDDQGKRLVGLYDNAMTGGIDGMKGIFMMSWDGTNAMGKPVKAGRYLVRWTLNGKYREVPVWFE